MKIWFYQTSWWRSNFQWSKTWKADTSSIRLSPERMATDWRRGLTLGEISAFQIFHGRSSTFISSFDTTKFSHFSIISHTSVEHPICCVEILFTSRLIFFQWSCAQGYLEPIDNIVFSNRQILSCGNQDWKTMGQWFPFFFKWELSIHQAWNGGQGKAYLTLTCFSIILKSTKSSSLFI